MYLPFFNWFGKANGRPVGYKSSGKWYKQSDFSLNKQDSENISQCVGPGIFACDEWGTNIDMAFWLRNIEPTQYWICLKGPIHYYTGLEKMSNVHREPFQYFRASLNPSVPWWSLRFLSIIAGYNCRETSVSRTAVTFEINLRWFLTGNVRFFTVYLGPLENLITS